MAVEYLNVKKTKHGEYSFEIRSPPETPLEVSMINGIRRTILNDIPTVSIPQENIMIETNDTSLHNEFMKHRISLLPLNLNPETYRYDYMISLDVKNPKDTVRVITTDDLVFYPLKKDILKQDDITLTPDSYDKSKPISDKLKKKILRPFSHQGKDYYIQITELKKMTSETNFQSLQLYCFPEIGTAKKNALYNNVSTCSYSFKESKELLAQAFQNEVQLKQLTTQVDINRFKKEFETSYRERYYYRNYENRPYWYRFVIKSYHYWNAKQVFTQGIVELMKRLERCNEQLKLLLSNPSESRYKVSAESNRYVFILEDENDTLGNVLQSAIERTLTSDSFIQVCGYKKTHPLEETIHLIISVNTLNELDESSILTQILSELDEIIKQTLNLLDEMRNKASSM